MSDNKEKKKQNKKLVNMIYISLFAALIAISAQIAVPIGQIPFTLQTLAVCVTSALLGLKRGTASILIYILLGVVGLPVFAGFAGGIGVLSGPTGGYIIGFVFVGLLVGFLTDKFGRKIFVLILSMIASVLLCYLFGTLWFMVFSSTDFLSSLMLCVVPYLPADALKIACASVIVNRMDKIIRL